MDILSSFAKVDRHGRFTVRLRVPARGAEGLSREVAVNKGDDRLAEAQFRMDHGARADVGLEARPPRGARRSPDTGTCTCR